MCSLTITLIAWKDTFSIISWIWRLCTLAAMIHTRRVQMKVREKRFHLHVITGAWLLSCSIRHEYHLILICYSRWICVNRQPLEMSWWFLLQLIPLETKSISDRFTPVRCWYFNASHIRVVNSLVGHWLWKGFCVDVFVARSYRLCQLTVAFLLCRAWCLQRSSLPEWWNVSSSRYLVRLFMCSRIHWCGLRIK